MSKKRAKMSKENFRLPDIRPETYVSEYFMNSQKLPVRILPDLPSMSPVKRDIAGIHNRLEKSIAALKSRKEKRVIDRAKLNNEWRYLEKNELMFKNSVQAFDQFLQDNRSKRIRTEKSIELNKKLIIKRQEDINTIRKKIDKCKEANALLKVELDDHDRYVIFMNEVICVSEDMFTEEHILNRYMLLKNTRENLLQKYYDQLNMMDEMKRDVMATNEDSLLSIIGFSNKLMHLRQVYEGHIRKSTNFELLVLFVINRCNELIESMSNVESIIEFMYKSICNRKKAPIIQTRDELPEMIGTISYTLNQLKHIIKIIYENNFASNAYPEQ